MKYQKRYIATRDIDWFCQINGIWIHATSAGGALPDIVNDRHRNIKMQDMVAAELDDNFSEALIANKELIRKELINNSLSDFIQINNDTTPFEAYVFFFKKMANKGFYSFDRTNINDPADNNYHLVAYPKKPLTDELQIVKEIPKVKCDFDIQSIINGDRIDLIDLLNGVSN